MSDEERVERQLRAFGASLQHEAGESLQPGESQSQSVGMAGSAHRPRRRWIVLTGTAASVALATVGGLWLVNGTERSLAPADTPITEPLATAPQPEPTSSSTEVISVVTSPPAETRPPIKTTLPDTQILGTVLDSSPLTARFEGCPTLGFTDLPDGWGERLEQLPTEETGVARFQLAAPNGQVLIEMGIGQLESVTQVIAIDGYPSTTQLVNGDVVRQIWFHRDSSCRAVRLVYEGLDRVDVEVSTAAIDIDNSAQTDVSAGIRIDDGPGRLPKFFNRGLGELVDAEPFIARTSQVYGEPSSDTGWMPMPPEFACTGSGEYRSIFWGDLRVVFERSIDNEKLSAFSVGDQELQLFVPDDSYQPTSSLNLGSQEGVAVGAALAVLEQFQMVYDARGGRYEIVGASVVVVHADGNIITGFGASRNDCS